MLNQIQGAAQQTKLQLCEVLDAQSLIDRREDYIGTDLAAARVAVLTACGLNDADYGPTPSSRNDPGGDAPAELPEANPHEPAGQSGQARGHRQRMNHCLVRIVAVSALFAAVVGAKGEPRIIAPAVDFLLGVIGCVIPVR